MKAEVRTQKSEVFSLRPLRLCFSLSLMKFFLGDLGVLGGFFFIGNGNGNGNE